MADPTNWIHPCTCSAPWARPDGCFGHCDPEGWYAPCAQPTDLHIGPAHQGGPSAILHYDNQPSEPEQ